MWHQKPSPLDKWPGEHEYLMSIDENGNANLRGVKRKLAAGETVDVNDRYVTITGVVMRRSEFPSFHKDVLQLKKQFWANGEYGYQGVNKVVCFHSREIRRKEGPFGEPGLDYSAFIESLSNLLADAPVTVYSATVDKVLHCAKYYYPDHPYELALNMIVERFCMLLREKKGTGIILLESRGRKEDKFLLNRINCLIKNGNQYYSPDHFNLIRGVYFNPKWGASPNGSGTYVTLELADLLSYPIHKYIRSNQRDKAFSTVEKKLFNYPNYMGYGLKTFP